jgi:succinate dehydrogenase flavin-adding protein (antitoxin of CptAB toxin-antitoxin module)
MNNVRALETKYHAEIGTHLRKALRGFHERYAIIKPSTEFQDGNYSFDLIYQLNFVVSVRIRQHKYMKYKDMTIRYKSKGGGFTEFDKIKQGYAKVYFYAYESEDRNSLVKVRIVDVDAIRKLIAQERYSIYKNDDGTELATFRFSDIATFGGAIYQYD